MRMNMAHRGVAVAAALSFGLTLLMAPQTKAAEAKLGSINLGKIYSEFYKTKLAKKTFEESVTAYRKDRQARIEDYNKLNEDFQKLREESNSQALTAEKREAKSKQAQEKLVELRKANQGIQDFEQSSQQFLGDQQRRQMDTLLKEILEVVRKKAKDAGYTVVFDTSGMGSGNLPSAVYADEKLDFTDTVLKEINANAPANLPASSSSTEKPTLTPGGLKPAAPPVK